MRVDLYTKAMLTVIALLLAVIAFKPFVQPQPVAADGLFSSVQMAVEPTGDLAFFDSRTGDLWFLHGIEQWGHQRVAQFGKKLQAFDPTTGMRLNHFAYGGIADVRVLNGETIEIVPGHPSDVDGGRCPHFSHIRKVNPRDQTTNQGAATFTLLFQMLRRGIPYGPLFSEEPDAERGLLFLAYQTSFKDQFRGLNTDWMNNPGAPELGNEAYDLLVGQNGGAGSRVATLHDAGTKKDSQIEAPAQFVIPTGGAFFFSPSVNFFRRL